MTEQLIRYLQMWDLSDPRPLAQTPTSHVYTVIYRETRVVLKLLTPIGVQDERNGAIALRCFAGRGAVRLLREDEQAHLLEYADGQDLVGMVSSGEDDKATAIIADVLNRLHSASEDSLPDGLTPLRTWFRALFKRAEIEKRSDLDSLYIRAAAIADTLLADPYDVRVLHGDIHHENIRHHTQRGWLAFDPKGLVGERTFDAANTLCNPGQMPDFVENEGRILRRAEILSQALDIDLSRTLAFLFAYVCLSASWYLEDGQYPRHELRIAEIVEPHIRA
jgi:streptomycin 6-kinase